ncbi:hypothetical protein FN846DRAFT_909651 [Sphaerosporella brunnea]|uniref:Uncharacterized protein n=1 Tax=Sphaerosporella brunnea TaxID=1250544 RepID=A0A5J5EQ53_9PEZI|nr:hypothetical protein FN846DRAFT_909651 [Sphaerosporella brunnea]
MRRDDLEVFRHPRVQRVIRGIKIFHAASEGDLGECLPITRDALLRILPRLDTNTQDGATYHAVFCTGFLGALRHVIRRSIHFLDDDPRVYLTLPASKTYHFGMGITVTIAAALDAGCPVKPPRHLFEKYPLPTSSPLFTLSGDSTAFTHVKVISRRRAILLERGVSANSSDTPFGGVQQPRPAPLAFRTPIYSY